ncbi:MAG: GNAT family N-acetyltransferase [Clostridia bacterium]|nr:GNAT family N-acetyltransferase [Clostridia bacterium]
MQGSAQVRLPALRKHPLAQWLGLDEAYTDWGRKVAGGEKNPAALFFDVRNTGAHRVLEKCGFLREDTVRQGKMVSLYCDYHTCGLLRSDCVQMKGMEI